MNKKWINCALNCEAYSSFEGVSFDHQIVTAKIRLSLGRNAVQTTTTAQYDWSLLNNRNIRDRYTIIQRNKFDVLQEISETLSPNDEFENFIYAHMEPVTECMPTKVSKVGDLVEGDSKASFSIATTVRCKGGCYSIPWIAPLHP